jgi:hypothetical protein
MRLASTRLFSLSENSTTAEEAFDGDRLGLRADLELEVHLGDAVRHDRCVPGDGLEPGSSALTRYRQTGSSGKTKPPCGSVMAVRA